MTRRTSWTPVQMEVLVEAPSGQRVLCQTREVSRSGLFVFLEPTPRVGDEVSVLIGEDHRVRARVRYRVPDIGVALEVLDDGRGALAAYESFADRLISGKPTYRHIGQTVHRPSEPVSAQSFRQSELPHPVYDAGGDRVVSVQKRASQIPQPAGNFVLELLFHRWTPFNSVVEKELLDWLAGAFTEEREYAVGLERKLVRFAQNAEILVRRGEAHRRGILFSDGERLAAVFEDDGAPPARPLEREDQIKLQSRSTPLTWETFFSRFSG